MGETCSFCGHQATAWHAGISWCDSPRCSILHDWATCEPRFTMPVRDATPLDALWLLPVAGWYWLLSSLVPVDWLLESGWRGRFAAWAIGSWLWYADCMDRGEVGRG